MSQYFRPTPNLDLKSTAMSAWSSGVLAAPLYNNDSWELFGSLVSRGPFSGLAVGASGYYAATATPSGAAFIQTDGSVVNYSSSGVATAYTLLAHKTWRGLAYNSGQNAIYGVNSAGALITPSGTGVVVVSAGFGVLSQGLASSGSTLFSILPSTNALGTFLLSSVSGGVSGSIAITGMDLATCLAATDNVVGVGGYSNVVIASGFNSISVSPNSTVFLGASSGSSTLSAWGNVTGTWGETSTVTTLSGVGFSAWRPDGLKAVATGLGADRFYAFSYVLGVLTQTQSLNIGVNPLGVAITVAGDYALACLGSPTNALAPLTFSGTWTASGATIALANPRVVASYSASAMVIGFASGLALATLSSSGVWSVTASAAVPGGFLPNSIYVSGGNVYAAGMNGTSGFFCIANGSLTITGSAVWAGNASGIAAVNDQVIVGDSNIASLRLFGSINGVYNQVATVTAPAGVRTIAVNGLIYQTQDIFASGTNQTFQYRFIAPYNLSRAQNGAVSIYSSGTWKSAALPTGQVPQCMTWNPSGNLDTFCALNTLYTFSNTASSLGVSSITQAANQPATCPIGISSMTYINGVLMGSTSLNDSIVQIK